MDKESITLLAELIRKKGDALLEGREKLMVSVLVLKNLNDAFRFLVEEENDDTSFRVIKTNNSKVEFFHDIEFLHDFIQKIVKLSVTNDATIHKSVDTCLDISRFKNLRFLELVQVPIDRVCGLQHLRTQLQCVICVHCLYNFRELLVGCGADRSTGFLWEELNEIALTYNALEALDNSLNYVPWLQTVDLSHNRLTSFNAVNCLHNLKYLDLSFNLLESAPTLSKEACRKLEVLVIRNNYITDISDVAKLENLKHLDLSCNCLPNHSVLISLQRLTLLMELTLLGNPLSFEPQHRLRTIKLLHSSVANCKFILDQKQLSWRERGVLRRAVMEREVQIVPERDLPQSVSFSSSSSSANNFQVSSTQNKEKTLPPRSKTSRLGRRVMEAVIAESIKDVGNDADEADADGDADADAVGEQNPAVFEGEQRAPAEIKRQVEELRERFGKENWLSQHGASQLHSVLGLPVPTPPPPIDTLLKMQVSQSPKFSPKQTSLMSTNSSPKRMETGVGENRASAAVAVEQESDLSPEKCGDEDVTQSTENNEDEAEEEEEECDEVLNDAHSEEDVSEGQLFTAWRSEQPSELLLLAVGTNHLWERELTSGQVKQRWEVAALQSCEKIASSPSTVQLTFDVLQNWRRKQTYQMESHEAQGLVRMLGDILAARSLLEMNQVPFRCMKCSTVFSHEEDARSTVKDVPVACPSCRSKIVCVMEEEPLPQSQGVSAGVSAGAHVEVEPPKSGPGTISSLASLLDSSPSQSSIGSDVGSSDIKGTVVLPGDRLQVAALVHHAADASNASPPQTTSPFRASPLLALASARSTASLESANNGPRRYDSDIEVISNPSQSSIEILDGESRTPGRKRSSEERHPAPMPVDTPPPSQPLQPMQPLQNVLPPSLMVGLTESSSSGSFTDSVCTTYETHIASPAPLEAEDRNQSRIRNNSAASGRSAGKKRQEEPIEEAGEDSASYNPGPPYTLQEMFEGLLESVDKKLATNVKPAPLSNDGETAIHYSYTDFQCVDHRLKLYLFQHIFEEEGEDVLLLLRTNILLQGQETAFAGLLILSSLRVCVLRVFGREGECPEEWLQKVLTQPLSTVNKVFPLPWAQGAGMFTGDSCILMLIQDQKHTHSFIAAAAGVLPTACGVVQECAEYHHLAVRQLVLAETPSGEGDAPIRLVALFCQCSAQGHEVFQLMQGAVVITTSDLILTRPNLQWLFPHLRDNECLQSQAAHKISNLLEVEVSGFSVRLQFLDEAETQESAWMLTFQSAGCVDAVVAALRGPWEQLFCVPLQVVLSTQSAQAVQTAH